MNECNIYFISSQQQICGRDCCESDFTICGFCNFSSCLYYDLYAVIELPRYFRESKSCCLLCGSRKRQNLVLEFYMLTSIIGTALAVLLGMPIGVLTAVFLAGFARKDWPKIVRPAVELQREFHRLSMDFWESLI